MPETPSTPAFCSACGKAILAGHPFCPHCGARIQTAAPKAGRSVKRDLEDVRKVGFWLALFITLPTLTLPSIFVNLISPGEMGVDEAVSIWQTLSLTAPLTAAVVIVVLAIYYEWFSDGCLGTLFVAGVLALTTLLSNLLNIGRGVDIGEIWRVADYHPVTFFNGLIASYYQTYGFWSFSSSLLVGCFIAWVWIEKILPYLLRPASRPTELG